MLRSPNFRGLTRSAWVAAVCFGGGVLVLASSAKDQPGLDASTASHQRLDLDSDGLTDQEEQVLGTMPYASDSDADGYSDLEERARRSDPLNWSDVPVPAEFSMNTCASLENGVVNVATVLYSANGIFDGTNLRIGIVMNGRAVTFSPSSFANTRRLIVRGRDSLASMGKVEVAVPESVVNRYGQLNFFSIVSSTGTNPPPPIVSVVSLVSLSGVIVQIEDGQVDDAMALDGHAKGVVYRPLAGGDRIPSTWNGGEICFQKISLVGMRGVSAIHEIESSDCQPMDTYCSPGDCAAAVGKSLERPDPGALAGG
jgi:hypothetical protein